MVDEMEDLDGKREVWRWYPYLQKRVILKLWKVVS